MILVESEEVLNVLVVHKNAVVGFLVALGKQLDGIAHHYDAVAQHYQWLTAVFLADQTVVLLVESVAVAFYVVDRIVLVSIVEIGTNIVRKLALVLLFILIANLLQFDLSK